MNILSLSERFLITQGEFLIVTVRSALFALFDMYYIDLEPKANPNPLSDL